MIAIAREKAARFRSTATFECRPVQSLSTTKSDYNVVISNFGALNCVPLPVWSTVVPQSLSPSGLGFVVLMGRRPLPEGVRQGFAASDRGEMADVRLGTGSVAVHYATVASVRKALSRAAVVTHIEAMGCLLPAPGHAGFARRHPMAMGLLAMGESIVRTAPLLRERGDHTLFEFQKR